MPSEYWKGLGIDVPTYPGLPADWQSDSVNLESQKSFLENQLKALEAELEAVRKTMEEQRQAED
jgi:hypothetical protein